jgi:hypothetical protein
MVSTQRAIHPESEEGPDHHPGEATERALGRWAHRLACTLGPRVLEELASFSRDATPGAMITVRATRDGFTSQTTSSIVCGGPVPPTVRAITDLVGNDVFDVTALE